MVYVKTRPIEATHLRSGEVLMESAKVYRKLENEQIESCLAERENLSTALCVKCSGWHCVNVVQQNDMVGLKPTACWHIEQICDALASYGFQFGANALFGIPALANSLSYADKAISGAKTMLIGRSLLLSGATSHVLDSTIPLTDALSPDSKFLICRCRQASPCNISS